MDYQEQVQKINEDRKRRLQEYANHIEEHTKKQTTELVNQLVDIRKQKGLSQQDIADATGIASSNIARVESCRRVPTFQVLMKYANALDLEIDITLKKKRVL